jgi:MFS family permease
VRPLQLYLIATGSWFLAWGIQSVMFAWLVTMVLRESPEMVGVAQMCLLLPATFFLLVGGSVADHVGGRRVAALAQVVAALPPFLLLIVIASKGLTFDAMIAFAIVVGLVQAFVTPARDGLLNRVAEGSVQRTVVLTSVIQFGVQMFGFMLASFAEGIGAEPILGVQAVVLLVGAAAFSRLPKTLDEAGRAGPWLRGLGGSIRDGARTVLRSRPMRMIAIQNCAMGVCFMGSYIVTLPLLLREVHDGTSADLGWLNAANSLGLVTTILMLMRFGDIQRSGRALLLAQAIGAIALGAIGVGVSFTLTIVCIFLWGMCGGIAMSMARTIMQEQAPPHQRSRAMSFYAFSFMGSGPIGALANGFLVDAVGPESALLIASATMFVVMAIIAARSSLWRLGVAEPTTAS